MIIKEDALMGYETPEEKEKDRLKEKKNEAQKKQSRRQRNLSYTTQSSEIVSDPDKIYEYTNKGNRVAVISDGSSVLNLGTVGPKAALPVVESKAKLLARYGGVEAIPLCLEADSVEELAAMIKGLSVNYGAIFLEDIASPDCIELQQRLRAELDVPVYHDDQQGAAIVILAALFNALKVVRKDLSETKVVINGIGTAGLAITRLLLEAGVAEITLCDKEGILTPESENLNFAQEEIIERERINIKPGNLEMALTGADVFIGVSTGNILSENSIKKMKKDPIIFALATPTPEIEPQLAKSSGAKVMATAHYNQNSNQINSQLVFPGLIKGLLDVRAKRLSIDIELIVARALANLVDNVNAESILPDPSKSEVMTKIAEMVVKAVNSENLDQIDSKEELKEKKTEDLPLEAVEHLLD